MMRDGRRDTRAVSEVLGFILLFSVVILSIGVVSIYGVQSLEDGRDAAIVNNVEQGFEGIDSIIDKLDTGISRSTSVQLRHGTIGFEGTTRVQVDIDGTTVLDEDVTPIVYEYDGQQLVYVASAVFRVQESGAVIVREPSFRLSDSQTVITVPRTEPIRSISTGGGMANLRFIASTPSSPTLESGSRQVDITVEAPTEMRADLWETALKERLKATSTSHSCSRPTDQEVRCEYLTDSDANILTRELLVEVDLS